MHLSIFGSGGQLGTAFLNTLKLVSLDQQDFHSGHIFIDCVPRHLDMSNPEVVLSYLAAQKSDWVVNFAAMTNVDGAEKNPSLAFETNALGAFNVAKAANAIGAKTIYVSTESVFDGAQTSPYMENDPTSPLSVYSTSKLAGEFLTQVGDSEAFILRTSWLYSFERGNNFVTRLIDQLESNKVSLPVVTDIVGNPTPTSVLSKAILRLISNPPRSGVFHISCLGSVSKYDWAVEIADSLGYDLKRIVPTTSSEFQTPAQRSKHVDLSCQKFISTNLMELPNWRASFLNSIVSIT